MDRTRTLMTLASLLAGCVAAPHDEAPSRGAGASERSTPAPVGKPEFVSATAADAIEAVVREAASAAAADSRRLVVYVGATWCEPCTRFHEAVERGDLDADLAGVRFLEFDADLHTPALTASGFGGRLIPRFAVPGVDGRGTDAKIEGGTKGDGAVAEIMARLRPLLAT